MALNLYLDDCANSDLLADLLSQAGHAVTRPADANLLGADDDEHFEFAIKQHLTLVTKNAADFLDLHGGNPQHSGILAVYQDNDLTRDLSDAEIVHAIANLENAAKTGGDPIEGHFHNLNLWRY